MSIYDWASNAELKRLKFPGASLKLALHPDGQHLGVCNANGTVYLVRLPELAKHSQPKP